MNSLKQQLARLPYSLILMSQDSHWFTPLLFSLFFTVPTFVGGQSFDVSSKTFTEKDGLSNNEVHAFQKDSRNLLWIGTKYGLNRYDGQDFEVFTREDGLQYNEIDRLYSSGDYLWVFYKPRSTDELHYTNGIDLINVYTKEVTPFATFFDSQLPFDPQRIITAQIIEPYVYFELNDHRNFSYAPAKGFQPVLDNHDDEKTLTLIPNQDHFYNEPRRGDSIKVLVKTDFNSLTQTTVSINTEDYLHLCLFAQNKQSYFLSKSYYKDSLYFTEVYSIENDELKLLFKKSSRDHIYLAHLPNIEAFWTRINGVGRLLSYEGQVLTQLYLEDIAISEMTFWHGDNGEFWQPVADGFLQLKFTPSRFDHHFAGQKQNAGFRAITKIDSLLFFVSGFGVQQTNTALTEPPKTVLPYALSLSVDSNKVLWGSTNKLLSSYHPATGQRRDYPLTTATNETWSLFQDGLGFWISQSGLEYFDPTTQELSYPEYSVFQELKHNTVYYFFPLSPGLVLLCTTSGLYEFDLRQKVVLNRYWSGGKGKYYLPTDDFRHLFYDEKKAVYWLATGTSGLVEWHPKSQTTKIHTFQDRATNVVHSVYPDDHGFLWMSTEHGIVQFEKATEKFRIHTDKDGLKEMEFNRISHFQDTDGRLFFGTINGVTVFHPNQFFDDFDQSIPITPYIIDHYQYLGASNQEELVTNTLLDNAPIILRPDDRYFRLTLGLKELDWAQGANYYYQILGHDENWTKAEGNQITLGSLPFGAHTLRIKVLLNNGRFANTYLDIPIVAQLPFYLKWWFIALCVIAIGGIFYSFFQYRLKQLKKRQLLRVQIASDLHDDVGSLLSRLAMQAEMITYVSKERAESIIQDIIATSKMSLDAMRDIIWAIDARNDTTSDIFLRMEEQLEELLPPAGIQYHIDIKKVTNEQPLSLEDRKNLFFIFKEAITNILKHSSTKMVFVDVVYTKKKLRLAIREELSNPNENQLKMRNIPVLTSKKTGVGIRNMKHRAQQMKADFEIAHNQGFRITLTKTW